MSSFTDVKDGGKSTSRIFKQAQGFCYNYELQPVAQFPFAGVKLSPSKTLDVSEYDYISCYWEVDTIKTIHVLIYFNFEDEGELFVMSEINAKPGKTEYFVPLKSFDFPSWFLKNRNMSRTKLEKLSLNKINSLRFSNNIFQPINKRDQICIEALQLGSYNTLQSSIALLIFAIGVLSQYLTRKLKNIKIEITYKPTDVKPLGTKDTTQQDIEHIISFINQNYMSSSLTLRMIRKGVGIPENKISLLLKKEFGISYKKYVNRLRVEEAKRLLRQEPDIFVSEVSDIVGFGGSTTFNKVFKEETGFTPSDFQQKNKS